MSVENRKAMYDKLIKEGRLSQDDGALEKEFGQPPTAKAAEPEASINPTLKKKGKK